MRTWLFAAACLFVFAAGSEASAQEEAPVDVAAADWRDDCRPRAGGSRGVMAQSMSCQAPARSALRQCIYVIDVRASALRFATGRRGHARVARCS